MNKAQKLFYLKQLLILETNIAVSKRVLQKKDNWIEIKIFRELIIKMQIQTFLSKNINLHFIFIFRCYRDKISSLQKCLMSIEIYHLTHRGILFYSVTIIFILFITMNFFKTFAFFV